MITDRQHEELQAAAITLCKDATPAEKAMVGVLTAVLEELRTVRKINQAFSRQFDQLSAGGNAVAVEVHQ